MCDIAKLDVSHPFWFKSRDQDFAIQVELSLSCDIKSDDTFCQEVTSLV